MTFFIIIIYFLFSYYTYKVLKGTHASAFGICYGALIGLIFFLAIPFFFIIIYGELTEPNLMISAYEPAYHLDTTFNLFLGWFVVLIAAANEKKVYSKYTTHPYSDRVKPEHFLFVMLSMYFLITLVAAETTGAFDEGLHWHDADRNNSAAFIIFKNFSNCYRVVIFGFLIYMISFRSVSKSIAIGYGAFFTLFDMALSFNRITVLYFLLFFILVNRRYAIVIFGGIIAIIPPVIYVSGVWTWFRGMASVGGIGLDSFIKAWSDATNMYEAAGDSFVIQMNNIFESSNILVFHALVQRVGDSIPVFFGSTYLVRPLTTFIPSTLWEDKPKVFGTYLGVYINDYEGLALNSTLFGEAYANFLYFWPVFLLLTLIGLSRLYLYFSKYFSPIKLMSVFIGVSIWRFDMNFTVACVYSLIFVYLLVLAFTGKKVLIR